MFLFFGLFAEEEGRDRHHRIFGYLEVQSVNAVGAGPDASDQPSGGGRSDGMGMQYLTLLLSDKNSLPIPRTHQMRRGCGTRAHQQHHVTEQGLIAKH
jgi:hypothetical protein